MVLAVRGATQVKSNTSEEIKTSVIELVERIMKDNKIAEEDIVSIIFSLTADITEINPATALRETGYAAVPLFCSQEPEYTGSLPRTIRILVTFNVEKKRDTVPVYLGGAKKLRPDLLKKG